MPENQNTNQLPPDVIEYEFWEATITFSAPDPDLEVTSVLVISSPGDPGVNIEYIGNNTIHFSGEYVNMFNDVPPETHTASDGNTYIVSWTPDIEPKIAIYEIRVNYDINLFYTVTLEHTVHWSYDMSVPAFIADVRSSGSRTPAGRGEGDHVISNTGRGNRCRFPRTTSTDECSNNVIVNGRGALMNGVRPASHPRRGCGTDTSPLNDNLSSTVYVNNKPMGFISSLYTSGSESNVVTEGSRDVLVG